jgi:aminoglycoside phosphotransferase (APT) family kinase protein
MASPGPDRVAEVRRVVAAHRPGYQVDSVVLIGAGLDHLAYEVNGELIVRGRTEPDPEDSEREARLLAVVAAVSPLPVPEPAFTVAEQGWLAYFKLPGVPLIDLPRPQRAAHGTAIAAGLGELLAALHAVPVDRVAELVGSDDHPPVEWRDEAAQTYATVGGHVPAAHRRPITAFLAAPPPDAPPARAFSHNDLGIEHVLVDPEAWTVTGVIDWSDAAITDPARDFGLIFRDLGPAAARAALDRCRSGPGDVAALRERAVFYARCSVFEDLVYGLETGKDRYVDKSLDAMEWLFPA